MQIHGDPTHHSARIVTNPAGVTLYERVGGHAGLHQLVKSFYDRARRQPVVGPVFSAHIQEWPEHIEKITSFWARLTGGPSDWNGGMGRHFFLQLGPEHFQSWLGVWDANCRALLSEPEAAEMSGLAHRIGEDLEKMINRQTRGPLR